MLHSGDDAINQDEDKDKEAVGCHALESRSDCLGPCQGAFVTCEICLDSNNALDNVRGDVFKDSVCCTTATASRSTMSVVYRRTSRDTLTSPACEKDCRLKTCCCDMAAGNAARKAPIIGTTFESRGESIPDLIRTLRMFHCDGIDCDQFARQPEPEGKRSLRISNIIRDVNMRTPNDAINFERDRVRTYRCCYASTRDVKDLGYLLNNNSASSSMNVSKTCCSSNATRETHLDPCENLNPECYDAICCDKCPAYDCLDDDYADDILACDCDRDDDAKNEDSSANICDQGGCLPPTHEDIIKGEELRDASVLALEEPQLFNPNMTLSSTSPKHNDDGCSMTATTTNVTDNSLGRRRSCLIAADPSAATCLAFEDGRNCTKNLARARCCNAIKKTTTTTTPFKVCCNYDDAMTAFGCWRKGSSHRENWTQSPNVENINDSRRSSLIDCPLKIGQFTANYDGSSCEMCLLFCSSRTLVCHECSCCHDSLECCSPRRRCGNSSCPLAAPTACFSDSICLYYRCSEVNTGTCELLDHDDVSELRPQHLDLMFLEPEEKPGLQATTNDSNDSISICNILSLLC